MIERKQRVAKHVVSAGEGWLTEMNDDQLRDLFARQPRTVVRTTGELHERQAGEQQRHFARRGARRRCRPRDGGCRRPRSRRGWLLRPARRAGRRAG